MEVRVFTHQTFRDNCPPELLVEITKRFAEYKRTGKPHEDFGRDFPYMKPQSVKDSDLWHLHVKDETSLNWGMRWIQIEKKTSDTALIYTRGFMNQNCYLLINFVKNAHAHYGGTDPFLRAMAVIARGFQEKF